MLLPSKKCILQHFDEKDTVMAGVIRRGGPFKLNRNKNYFQVLCKAIVGQQISTKAAESINHRFQTLFSGNRPTPKKVQGLAEKQLREVGLSGQKVKYMKDLSEKFIDGTVRPHLMAYQDNEEIIQQLTKVYGIGRWTAEMFLIFSLNRLDVLPVGDLGLRAGVRQLYNMRALPSPDRVRALGKKWQPYATVGTWYTWRTLDEGIIAY
ncbi:MAG: DNA-3-methyladenine glycosylase 2 family protein [Nitrospinae bacterium]|nr:DNA-3-methyladenine glycosylase 2 family protein [Nitrospinota bacterium]